MLVYIRCHLEVCRFSVTLFILIIPFADNDDRYENGKYQNSRHGDYPRCCGSQVDAVFLICQLIYVFLNLVMFDHHDYKVYSSKEIIQVMVLVGYNILLNEGILDLQAGRKVALLALQQLKGRAFSHIINVFLICKPI